MCFSLPLGRASINLFQVVADYPIWRSLW